MLTHNVTNHRADVTLFGTGAGRGGSGAIVLTYAANSVHPSTNKCECHEQSAMLDGVGRGKAIGSALWPDHIDCLHTMLTTIVRMLHFVLRQTLKVFFTLHAYTVADWVHLSSNLN